MKTKEQILEGLNSLYEMKNKSDMDEKSKKYEDDKEHDCKCKGEADCKCDEKKEKMDEAVKKGIQGDPNPISKRDLNSVKAIGKKLKSMPRIKAVENMAYDHFTDGSPEQEALLQMAEAMDVLESAVDRIESVF